jgi:HPt (histidine-containing phosphotransfer) domain-containing protein
VRTGGDAALAYEVALEMLSLLPGASQALAGMVAREDGDAVAHEAHKFRGALMTSGLPRAARAAADLEATARIAPDRTEAFVAFARELARAEVALEACLETRDSRRVPSAG